MTSAPASRFFSLTNVAALALVAVAAFLLPGISWAEEVEVKNDSVADGTNAKIIGGFVEGESAAVWLTSPCQGSIVELRVFWRSLFGSTGSVLHGSLSVFRAGTFPVPGELALELQGPELTDGFLNSFAYHDENQLVPISVPVDALEDFVVSLRFNEDIDGIFTASVVADNDGTCKLGRNAISADVGGAGGGFVWGDACLPPLGVTGDFFIRAVVGCQGAPDVIHSDDFESNSFDGWDSVVGGAP